MFFLLLVVPSLLVTLPSFPQFSVPLDLVFCSSFWDLKLHTVFSCSILLYVFGYTLFFCKIILFFTSLLLFREN